MTTRLFPSKPPMTLYFAYGSNMDPGQMKQRCPKSIQVGPALLPDYRLAFAGYSSARGGGVATVLFNRKHTTPGIVWMMTAIDMAALDRFEGVPHQYRRTLVEVRLGEQNALAMTYKLKNNDANAPRRPYLERIQNIYRQQNWDTSLLERIKPCLPRVFVYGSLRRGCMNHHHLEGAKFIRQVRTSQGFRLHDLGPFPAMVWDAEARSSVVGEVWEVSEEHLANLDRFEGHPNLYCRKNIYLEDGSRVDTYLYARQNAGRDVIPDGDWVTWERRKNTNRRSLRNEGYSHRTFFRSAWELDEDDR